MSIQLEYNNFIVPIATIKAKYPGGWEQCLIDHNYSIGRRVWYDDHLFRDGGMGPADIDKLVNKWQLLGFNPYLCVDDKPVAWLDMCSLGGLEVKPSPPCDWLTIDEEFGHASLTGADPCPLVYRTSFTPTDENPFLR